MAPLPEARGCLTEAEFRTVESAPLGRAPSELSTHLASCGHCQDRLLLRSAGASFRREARKTRPPAWRIVVVLAMAMLLTVVALVAARWLGR